MRIKTIITLPFIPGLNLVPHLHAFRRHFCGKEVRSECAERHGSKGDEVLAAVFDRDRVATEEGRDIDDAHFID